MPKKMQSLSKMHATLFLPGKWLLSKQNSLCAGRNGRKYKNPKYVSETKKMIACMLPQLRKQEWICTRNEVEIKIFLYYPSKPCDFDNIGVLTDAMQGATATIGGKRMRGNGLVVFDDKQFNPGYVEWIKSPKKCIVVELYERIK
jgi:hypothetical protein